MSCKEKLCEVGEVVFRNANDLGPGEFTIFYCVAYLGKPTSLIGIALPKTSGQRSFSLRDS